MRRLAAFIALLMIVFLGISVSPGEAVAPANSPDFPFISGLIPTSEPGTSSVLEVNSADAVKPIDHSSESNANIANGGLTAIDVSLGDLASLQRYEIVYQDQPRKGFWRAAATNDQLTLLNQAGIAYRLAGKVAIVEGGINQNRLSLSSIYCFGYNTADYPIPYNDWVYDPIFTNCLDATTVEYVDIYYDVVHPYAETELGLVLGSSDDGWMYTTLETFDYCAPLKATINSEWHKYQYDITFFNGQDVNQRWDLVVKDFCPDYPYGYIDDWYIWVYYSPPPPVLSGHVYNGVVGDTSQPLVDVLVALYCASTAGEYGSLLEYTYTDSLGAYYLTAGSVCNYYNIVEWNSASYVTMWADSIGGTVMNGDWIRYSDPLEGKTLSGNNFWDISTSGPALSGHVYSGSIGDTSTPLEMADMGLFCANTSEEQGVLIGRTETDGSGAYSMTAGTICNYYNITQGNLPGYTSVGASSVGGTVKNSDWIQYTNPLPGKTLSDNNFWDVPPSGITHCNSCDDCNAKLTGDYSLVYLDNDISTQNSTCINFATSNTTFDCQGHKITGIIQGGESLHGINMAYQTQNTIRSCQVTGFPSGITLQNSSHNSIAGNVLSNNGSGLYLNGSSNNQITDNLVGYNNDGMALWSANNNSLSGNMVCKNKRDIVLPDANSGNTRSGDMCDAIYGWNWNGSDPPPIPQWCDQTCTPNEQKTCTSVQDCLDSIKGNYSTVTLGVDLSLPGGLPVTGNHMTLNCAGHAITGSGSGVGILVEDKLDVIVESCTVQNFATGIELRDTSLSTLYQNNTRNNTTGIALTGIDPLYAPSNNEVDANFSSDNTNYGIQLSDVENNDITDNNLTSNGLYGLWLSGSCNNNVSGNTSGQGSSMLYMHDQPNGGIIDGINYSEIVLCNVQNATVRNITMDSGDAQGDGIVVLDSNGIQLRNNTLNHTNGIYASNTQGMTIADNQIQNSRRNALELNNCNGCAITNNQLEQNPGVVAGTGTGLYVSNDSPLLQITNNTVMTNSVGIWLQDVDSPYLSGNNIRHNTSTGLVADGTDGLAFHNNLVRNNDYGVQLDYQSSANMQNNNLCYNTTLDILNENTNSTGSGNSCMKVSNWLDSGQTGQGCSQKCIGWYHYNYGYSFPNTSKTWLSFGCPYGGCQGDYVDTFGENQVYQTLDVCIGIPICLPFIGCKCLGYETKVPTPIPEPTALAYYFAAYGYAASPGSCQGMSTTSLRFFYGDRLVTDYGPSADKVSDLPYYGDLEDAIDAAQGANRAVELLKNFMANVGTTQPNTVLSQVRQSLAQGKPGIIIEYHLGGGHAVVATDVRDIDATTARIYIYDSNFPEHDTNFAESEDQYTYITIHTDTNSWEYVNQGENDQIWFMPYSTVAGRYTLPLNWEGDIVAAWGDATTLVTDQAGRRLGWEGSQLVSEIPEAAPYPQIGDNPEYNPAKGFYLLPRGTYTATITGNGSGSYNTAVFAGNQVLMLEDVPSTPTTHDIMRFFHENDNPPTGGFAFTSIDATKPFTATISEQFDSSDSTRVYRLRDCMTIPGHPAIFSVTPDFNSLRLTNRSVAPMFCSVELQNTMARSPEGSDQSIPTALLPDVVIPGMTTALFTPSDWLDLNHATITTDSLSCGDDVCSSGEDPMGCPEDCQQQACVTPMDDLHLTSSTVLCPGTYNLPDQGDIGVVIIEANGVSLDCNGARLIGGGTGVGIRAADRSDVTITGCTVQGYGAGIGIRDTSNAQVESSTVISNTASGIYAAGSQGALVEQSYMAANPIGMNLTSAAGAQLSSNLICGNSSLDISAASISGGVGISNRCQSTLGWKDQGVSSCTYPCSIGSGYLYLPLVKR